MEETFNWIHQIIQRNNGDLVEDQGAAKCGQCGTKPINRS
jgi:hypothetical protein